MRVLSGLWRGLLASVISVGLVYAQAPGGPGPSSSKPTVQVITTSGTWIKPVSASWVKVFVYPGGTGAFNGFACPNTSICSGPSGPGGGSMGIWEGPASILPATVAVVVGAAGVSGASPTQGGGSTFGTFPKGFASGFPGGLGQAGSVGVLSVAGSGAGNMTSLNDFAASNGAVAASFLTGSSGGACAAAGTCTSAGAAQWGGTGAGAGGGIITGGVAQPGTTPRGNSGSFLLNTVTPICTNGQAVPAPTGMTMGASGFGGGACTTGPAGNGSDGAFPGGAAGAGGDGYNGTTPGTAGNAAAGAIIVITW